MSHARSIHVTAKSATLILDGQPTGPVESSRKSWFGGVFYLDFPVLKPLENETQPQFAIRFHTEMASQIPDTVLRNKACFAAWDEAKGEDPTISEIVERRFPADQYQRLRDVAHFHEHEIPEHKINLPDGTEKQVPAIKYGRDELAAMVEGMNDRILDHDEFSPITRGHTGAKPGSKDGERQIPEILGFAGPYRLGMIGRKNPRWAIFGAEYHMKEAVPELRKRVGRSPEVWRYSRAKDRFFYPIASLAEEMPRLNLPPAHYSRRGSESEPIFVECYTAVMPGGSNTFVPSFQGSSDKRKPMVDGYSADGGGSAPDADGLKFTDLTVGEFLNLLFETQPMQFVFSQMKAAGIGGNPNPAMQNDIPPDPNGPDPNAGSPAAGPAGAAAAPPVAAPAPGSPVSAAPPAPPAAPPVENKTGLPPVASIPTAEGKKDNYSRSERDILAENEQLRIQLNALAKQLEEVRFEKTRVERYSRLNELAQDYLLVPETELERTASYTDEQFEAHCEIIRDNYQRSLVSESPNYAALAGDVPSGPAKSPNSLGKEDVVAIEKYCIEHGCGWDAGKEIYVANNKTFPVSVT